MKTYLAGPINGCTDAQARDWREAAKLDLIGTTYDPMVRDYRGREHEDGIEIEIVELDKEDILMCDALLVMFPQPSVGTAMEVLFAHTYGKHVVVVNVSGKPPSPWLKYHASRMFTTLEDAIAHLNSETRRRAAYRPALTT